MKFNKKILISSTVLLALSGCSGKNFTMQDYADKWFNDKSTEDVKEESKISITQKKEQIELSKNETATVPSKTILEPTTQKSSSYIEDDKTNRAIKSGVGADIAWSSTYKQDEKMKGEGSMQKSLDTWTKEKWAPATEGDIEQTKEDKKANKNFTIQHYVDKVEKYLDNKEKDSNKSSHYETLNKMPVIGK